MKSVIRNKSNWVKALGVLSDVIWVGEAALLAGAIHAMLMGSADWFHPALGILGLGAFRIWSGYWVAGQLDQAARSAVTAIRSDFASQIFSRSSVADASAARPGPGALAAVMAEKLEQAIPHLATYELIKWRLVSVPLVLLLSVGMISWAAALILFVVAPLIPVFMALIGMFAKAAADKQLQAHIGLSDLMLDRLRGLVDLKLLGAEERVAAEFAHTGNQLREKTMAVLKIAFLSSAVLELFASLGVAMVAVYVGFSLLHVINFGAWVPLSLADGLFILLLAPAYFAPLRAFASAWHDRASASSVLTEVEAFRDSPAPPIVGSWEQAPALPSPHDIVLKAVEHERLSAPPLHLRLPAGSKVALTGPSGSGKSTLLSMIAGMTPPDAGQISVAGASLEASMAASWRQSIAWIDQLPHLFQGSVRHNVDFLKSRTDGEIWKALDSASLTRTIHLMEAGLASHLGEAGVGLSGGEGRRLAIARAVCARRPVILADEPTAHLDTETAQQVIEGLRLLSAQEGVTMIIATHDRSLIELMDVHIQLGTS